MSQFNLDDYEPVHVRIKKFLEKYEDGKIVTELKTPVSDLKVVVFEATLYNGSKLLGNGHAFEVAGQGYVNKTSHLENCETSAIGRALANIGLHGDLRPSREEMQKTGKKQDSYAKTMEAAKGAFPGAKVESRPAPSDGEYVFTFGKYKDKTLSEVGHDKAASYLDWLKNSAKQQGKPLSKSAIELEQALGAPVNEEIPFPTDTDEIPF